MIRYTKKDDISTEGWGTFRKKTTIKAFRVANTFEVETMGGLMQGKAGDWLAKGAHGELYPIDAKVFEDTYEEVKP